MSENKNKDQPAPGKSTVMDQKGKDQIMLVPFKKRKHLYITQDAAHTTADVPPSKRRDPPLIYLPSEPKTRDEGGKGQGSPWAAKNLTSRLSSDIGKELQRTADAAKQGIPTPPRQPRTTIRFGGSRQSSFAKETGLVFLFEVKLNYEDFQLKRLCVPWKIAEKFFPPHTHPYTTTNILISDDYENSWNIKLLIKPENRSYMFFIGWRDFAVRKRLEAHDKIGFFRHPEPTKPFHFLVRFIRANKFRISGSQSNESKGVGSVGLSSSMLDGIGGSSPSDKGKAKVTEDQITKPVLLEKNVDIDELPIAVSRPKDISEFLNPVGKNRGIDRRPTTLEEEEKKKRKKKQQQQEEEEKNKVPKLNIKIEGFRVNFLFEKELSSNEVTNKNLRIPTQYAERHFPPLKTSRGFFEEEKLLISDAWKKRWWMKFKFSLIAQAYVITGHWGDFVEAYDLKGDDKIRFFKVAKDVPDKHYFIDFIRKERR